MMDYASWLRRAERFVRQLNDLPGRWGISVSVAPPLSEVEALDLHKALPFGLPAPLREFYVTASASCRCTYHWSPPEEDLPKLQALFPDQDDVYGGARIISAADLPDAHAIHEWVDEMAVPAKAKQIWRATVPFLAVDNGDCLALHVAPGQSQMPVVYLSHDDEEFPVTQISPSFDEFLTDWETLYYLGPEIWLLVEFLDNAGAGPLDVGTTKAQAWRALIGTAG